MKPLKFINKFIFLSMIYGCSQISFSAPISSSTYPTDAHYIKYINLHPIDNLIVRDIHYQDANNIDYFWKLPCKWYISDDFKINEESFYILYQDYYWIRNYYLCRKSNSDSYPEILLICIESVSGSSNHYFKINEQEGTITITNYEPLPKLNSGNSTSIGKETYSVESKTYTIHNRFDLLDTSYSQEILSDDEVYISLYE